MILEIPDEMIREAIYFGSDESVLLHLAEEVLEQATKEHPEWMREEV